jgi:hypothetical protein
MTDRKAAGALSHRALVVDVDGVVSPVHGNTAWRDDVVAGSVFGPVHVSPAMCRRLDALAEVPGVSCWWLTSWSREMRHAMNPFPGRRWPAVAESGSRPGRAWWKLVELEGWVDRHPEVASVAWCDDHLRSPTRAAAVRRRLDARGVEVLVVAPDTAVGLTPADLDRVEEWLRE